MKSHLIDANEELKRVDHLIYVSLKYTRTTDVLKNVIQRMITTSNCLIGALEDSAKKQGLAKFFPPAPIMKTKELKKLFTDNESVTQFLEFYVLLRALNKAEYSSINEYRRHVTLIAQLDEGEYHVHIDKVTDFYKDLKRYFEAIKYLE